MMRLSSFFVFTLFSSLITATELDLHKFNDEFYELKALNNSNIAVDIDSQLCLSQLGNISFLIKDKAGKERPLAVRLNDKCKLGSTVTLQPYRFIGRRFHIEEFKTYYQLSKGSYDVSALLCDLPNINEDRNCQHSKTIKLTISH